MVQIRQKNSRLSRTTGLLLGAALSLVALPGPAAATSVPWPDEPLAYTVVDQDLRDLLAEIGARLGVRLPPAPREFLAGFASIHGFEWFCDGGTIWVSAPSESQTRMMQLGPVPLEQMTGAMNGLDLSDPRWPPLGSEQAGVVVVNGPPRFVAMAKQARAEPGAAAFRARPRRPPRFTGSMSALMKNQ